MNTEIVKVRYGGRLDLYVSTNRRDLALALVAPRPTVFIMRDWPAGAKVVWAENPVTRQRYYAMSQHAADGLVFEVGPTLEKHVKVVRVPGEKVAVMTDVLPASLLDEVPDPDARMPVMRIEMSQSGPMWVEG